MMDPAIGGVYSPVVNLMSFVMWGNVPISQVVTLSDAIIFGDKAIAPLSA